MRFERKYRSLLGGLLIFACGYAIVESAPALVCNVGPAVKVFGKTNWLVYSCIDNRSLIFVSAPGNPAGPFVFSLMAEGSAYHLRGEGTGNKNSSDAALGELQTLSTSSIIELIKETRQVGSAKQAK
jgi:hypothetical protein